MKRGKMTLKILLTMIFVLSVCFIAIAKENIPVTPSSVGTLDSDPYWDLKDANQQSNGQSGFEFDFNGKYAPHKVAGVTKEAATSFLSEDFEVSVPPALWSSVVTNASFTWFQTVASAYSGTASAQAEYDPALVPQDEWLISPVMDLSTATAADLRLDFWFLMSYYWGVDPFDNYDLEVYISTDGGATFPTLLWEEADAGIFTSWAWYNVVIDLSAYNVANVAIGLRYVGSDGAQGNFDLVQILDDPAPVGRCCYGDPGAPTCDDVTLVDCDALLGSWDAGLTCAGDPCPVAGPGDNCAEPLAIDLPADLPYLDKDQFTCSRGNDYENTCLGLYDSGEDIIYELTVTSAVDIDITLDPKGTTYSGISVSDACGDGNTCIASVATSSGAAKAITGLHLEAGTYFIQVDTWAAPDCIPDFDLTIEAAAAATEGDNCAAPLQLSVNLAALPAIVTDYTCGRNDSYSTTCMGSYDGGEDFILELDVTEAMTVDITLDPKGSTWSGIAIHSTCPLDPSTCLGVITSSSGTPKTIIGVDLAVGTYYIQVDTWPSPACIPDFDIIIDGAAPPPANDDCADAEVVGDVVDLAFSTSGASFDGPGGCLTSPNVWYAYTATIDGAVHFSLCGSGYDTKMAVYDGFSCAGAELACNDDAPCVVKALQSEVILSCSIGDEFLIEVGGYSSSVGNGILNISTFLPPPNDNCEDVTPVTLVSGITETFTGDNTNATNQCASFPNGHVWEAFTIPTFGSVTLDYCGTSPAFGNAWLNLALGCPCAEFTPGGDFNFDDCGDGNVSITWAFLTPGTYYYPVLNDPAYGAVGPYTINVVYNYMDPAYCDAEGGCDEYIERVELGSINNTSGCDNYGDYTGIATELCGGDVYLMTVDIGNGWSSDYVEAWIDWNQDYVFDASEAVGLGPNPGTGPVTASVSVPVGALAGATRMRVRLDYANSNPSPCGTTSYGEAEDYTIIVTPQDAPIMLDPDPQYLYYTKAMTPIQNWLFMGNLGFSVNDLLSIDLNAGGTPWYALYWAPSWTGFSCGEIFVVEFPLNDFMAPYTNLIGIITVPLNVSGFYDDGGVPTFYSFPFEVDVYGKDPLNPARYLVPGDIVVFRGDNDISGSIDISDAVFLINFIFNGGEHPTPHAVADVNCSLGVDISDAVFTINYIFNGGPAPCESVFDHRSENPNVSDLEQITLDNFEQ